MSVTQPKTKLSELLKAFERAKAVGNHQTMVNLKALYDSKNYINDVDGVAVNQTTPVVKFSKSDNTVPTQPAQKLPEITTVAAAKVEENVNPLVTNMDLFKPSI